MGSNFPKTFTNVNTMGVVVGMTTLWNADNKTTTQSSSYTFHLPTFSLSHKYTPWRVRKLVMVVYITSAQ